MGEKLSSIYDILKKNLSKDLGFEIFILADFVAIVHPTFGLATVVPEEQDREQASTAFSLFSNIININQKVIGFSMVNKEKLKEYELPYNEKAGSVLLTTMASLFATKPTFLKEDFDKLIEFITKNINLEQKQEEIKKEDKEVKNKKIDEKYLFALYSCFEQIIAGRNVKIIGMDLSIDDLINPKFVLPGLLIMASEEWALPVLKKKGIGGFEISIIENKTDALFGYEAVDIKMSSSLFLFMPLMNIISRMEVNGEIILDPVLNFFSDFMERKIKVKVEDESEDLELKIILSSDN